MGGGGALNSALLACLLIAIRQAGVRPDEIELIRAAEGHLARSLAQPSLLGGSATSQSSVASRPADGRSRCRRDH